MGFAPATRLRPQQKFIPQPEAQRRWRIAFVCLGNSCRSQMAEGWVRHLVENGAAPAGVEAVSAGLTPLGYITPETIEVMEEKKVSLAGQQSKGLEAIDWQRVDLLVNMTPVPLRSVVPSFPGRAVEWKVADPYGQPLRTYRRVRDQLERKVKRLLAERKDSSPGTPTAPPVA